MQQSCQYFNMITAYGIPRWGTHVASLLWPDSFREGLIALSITERSRGKSLVNQVPKSCPTLTSTETLVIMSVKYFQRGVKCRHCQSTVSLVMSVFKK